MVADGAESGWRRRRRPPRGSTAADEVDRHRADDPVEPVDAPADDHVVDVRVEDHDDWYDDDDPTVGPYVAPLPALPGRALGMAAPTPPWHVEVQIGNVIVAADEDAVAIGRTSLRFEEIRAVRMKVANIQVNKIQAVTYRVELVADRTTAELKTAAGSKSGAEETGRLVGWLLAVVDAKVVPRIVHRALSDIHAGRKVPIAGLVFSRDGISKGRIGKAMPWRSIRGTTLHDDSVLVFADGRGASFVAQLDQDNAFAIPALVDEARRFLG